MATEPAVTGHVFIAASMDGFIARRDGDIEWMTGHGGAEPEDHGFDAFIATMDGFVMGRGTYEKVLTFGGWPFAKPVVVLSGTLTDADLPAEFAGKARFSAAAPHEVMAELGADGWRRAYVDGGKVIQSFLREGLIRDMIVTRIPALIGEGIPLFGPTGGDIRLRHVETKAFPSGLVQSKYEVGD